jgi:cytochrome d ubiquinol oxidase subunit II
MAVIAGLAAAVGVVALRDDARYVYDGLTSMPGIVLVILSAICGVAALGSMLRGVAWVVRPAAVGAVVAVVWGYFAASHPYMLPTTLKIGDAAGASATLTEVIVVFVIAGLTCLPALGLLYWLSQRGALEQQ